MSGFSAEIGANIDNFEKNIAKAQKDIDNFSKNVSDKLSKVGDSFIKVGGQLSVFSGAIAGVVTGMGALALSTANYTKDLDSLSTITGITTDMLQEYELIALKATVPTDALAQATMSLTRRLKDVSEDGGGATETLRKLGVSLKDSSGAMKSAGRVAEDAILALAGLEKGVETNALGVSIFGRQWNDVIQIVDLGADEIANLKNEAHDLGLVLSEEAIGASANFGIAVDVLKLRLTALKNQIGTALAPMLTDTLIPILENQIMPAFQRFTDFVKQLIDRFNALSAPTKAMIAGITGIAVALGPTLLAIGGLLKMLPLIGAGFTALTGPVGIAVAAIVAGASLIVTNWDAIKEYFTNGGGSELFKAIKALTSNLFDTLKTTFNNIKDVVLSVWDSIGSNVVRQLGLVVDTVVKSLTFVTNIVNDFLNILRSEPKDVLENLKTFFVNAFTGILDIVKNVLASVTNQLSGFFRLLKLDKWADSLTNFSEKLAPIKTQIDNKNISQTNDNKTTEKAIQLTDGLADSLDKLGSKSLIPQGSLKELSENLKVLYEKLDNETTQSGRIKVANLISDLEKKVIRIKVGVEMGNTNIEGIKVSAIDVPIIDLSPQIDKMGADLDRMQEVLDEKSYELANGVQMMNQMLVGGFVGVFAGLGEAIASGENVLGALGKSLVGALGDMAMQIGSMMIGFGAMAESLWTLIATPLGGPLAIAAGAALIALGAAAKSAVGGAMKGGLSGGSSGGGGYNSTRVDAPMQQGEFDMRQSYQGGQSVEFKISGDNLVGVLDRKETKRNRNL